MSELTKKNEKVEEPEDKEPEAPIEQPSSEGNTYLFPTEGIAITAKSREEAEQIYHKTVKQNKESDND